ncbi:MAG: transposase, partial [Proteobacteria bacterium]|nr:transposase [Pseudomonadota bacterium]
QGKRPELTGGGLVRSLGGWSGVKAIRTTGERIKGDERILGSSEFVEKVLKAAGEQMHRSVGYRKKGLDIQKLINRTADYFEVAEEDLRTNSKAAEIVTPRSLVCYLAVRELGISSTEVARQLNITPAAVSRAVRRGKHIASVSVIKSILH